jgi:ABC-type sugar transport system substrate-binding protein
MSDIKKGNRDEDFNASTMAQKTLSRRDFLKIAGAAGATVGLGGGFLLGGTKTATAATSLSAFEKKVEAIWKKRTQSVRKFPMLPGPKGVKGKKLAHIPIISECDVCHLGLDEFRVAAELLDWKVIDINPHGDPVKMADAIDQAITMKVDGVELWVIDANLVLESLRNLKRLGIPVGAYASEDVNPPLYSFLVTPPDHFFTEGYTTGAAAYRLTGGDIRAITAVTTDASPNTQRLAGFRQFIADANAAGAKCKIVSHIDTTVGNAVRQLPGQVISEIRKHPGYNTLWICSDNQLAPCLGPLAEAGMDDPKKVGLSHDGIPIVLENIRKGGIMKATVGEPTVWGAWSAVDDFNRIFNGVKPLSGNRGFYPAQLFYAGNLPNNLSEPWDAYMKPLLKKAFAASWGVKS